MMMADYFPVLVNPIYAAEDNASVGIPRESFAYYSSGSFRQAIVRIDVTNNITAHPRERAI
jgi:hypothetical protein